MTARPRKRNVIFPKHQTAEAMLVPVGICLPLLFRVLRVHPVRCMNSLSLFQVAVNLDGYIIYLELKRGQGTLMIRAAPSPSSSTEKFLSIAGMGEVMRWKGVFPMSWKSLCFKDGIHRMQLHCHRIITAQCGVFNSAQVCKVSPDANPNGHTMILDPFRKTLNFITQYYIVCMYSTHEYIDLRFGLYAHYNHITYILQWLMQVKLQDVEVKA